MHEYVSFIIHLAFQDGALAFLVGLGVLAAAAVAAVVLRRLGRSFSWKRAVVLALLAGYFAALCSMTLTGRTEFGARSVSLYWFRAWREAWNSFSIKNWLLVLLNVAAFMPLGILLPLAFLPFRRWYVTVPAGFFVSLAIETLQYVTRCGTFDVDDLFTNTLGCTLGYCLVMTALVLLARKPLRQWLPYLACPAAFCLTVVGIFAAYALQPYGNLALAPAYRVDLSEIRWNLDFVPADEPAQAMIYQAPRLDRQRCDAFGAAFAALAGITFPDAYYYDDLTLFANHTTGDFLSVDYRNSSYIYRLGTPQPAEATRHSLQQLLTTKGIAVPDGAEFTQEDNTCTFSANFLQVGDVVYDGVVNCHMEDGAVTEIENFLVPLTPCREEPIRTQAEAYTRLVQGCFTPAEPLAALQPAAVAVTACTLSYRVDTKGFYQPVYLFTLVADGQEADQALIPALKSFS